MKLFEYLFSSIRKQHPAYLNEQRAAEIQEIDRQLAELPSVERGARDSHEDVRRILHDKREEITFSAYRAELGLKSDLTLGGFEFSLEEKKSALEQMLAERKKQELALEAEGSVASVAGVVENLETKRDVLCHQRAILDEIEGATFYSVTPGMERKHQEALRFGPAGAARYLGLRLRFRRLSDIAFALTRRTDAARGRGTEATIHRLEVLQRHAEIDKAWAAECIFRSESDPALIRSLGSSHCGLKLWS